MEPISRSCFESEAMLALAQRICEERQGRERRGALVHVETVSEQVYLVLGLTADAGDECIELLRLFDNEGACSGLTSSQIQEFPDRITNLASIMQFGTFMATRG